MQRNLSIIMHTLHIYKHFICCNGAAQMYLQRAPWYPAVLGQLTRLKAKLALLGTLLHSLASLEAAGLICFLCPSRLASLLSCLAGGLYGPSRWWVHNLPQQHNNPKLMLHAPCSYDYEPNHATYTLPACQHPHAGSLNSHCQPSAATSAATCQALACMALARYGTV